MMASTHMTCCCRPPDCLCCITKTMIHINNWEAGYPQHAEMEVTYQNTVTMILSFSGVPSATVCYAVDDNSDPSKSITFAFENCVVNQNGQMVFLEFLEANVRLYCGSFLIDEDIAKPGISAKIKYPYRATECGYECDFRIEVDAYYNAVEYTCYFEHAAPTLIVHYPPFVSVNFDTPHYVDSHHSNGVKCIYESIGGQHVCDVVDQDVCDSYYEKWYDGEFIQQYTRGSTVYDYKAERVAVMVGVDVRLIPLLNPIKAQIVSNLWMKGQVQYKRDYQSWDDSTYIGEVGIYFWDQSIEYFNDDIELLAAWIESSLQAIPQQNERTGDTAEINASTAVIRPCPDTATRSATLSTEGLIAIRRRICEICNHWNDNNQAENPWLGSPAPTCDMLKSHGRPCSIMLKNRLFTGQCPAEKWRV